MNDPSLLLWGTPTPPPDWIELTAGPLTLYFDPAMAALRTIRLGQNEVIRAIYGAVRDAQWGTVPARISELQIESLRNQFQLRFQVECRQDEIDFLWQGNISGQPDGTICFVFDGQARSRFQRNRIGLCVLHPLIECRGRACRVDHVDGRSEQSRFPEFIAPHQPFRDVRGLAHEILPGVGVRIDFTGDVFETEDQRNWTDASFKTYSTPLARPFPITVPSGAHVRQEVRVSLDGVVPPLARSLPKVEASLRLGPIVAKPAYGITLAPDHLQLSTEEASRVQRLQLGHLRIDLELSDPGWRRRLQLATDASAQIQTGLALALHFSQEAPTELTLLCLELSRLRPNVVLSLLYPANRDSARSAWVLDAAHQLRQFDPGMAIAAGSDANFAEWNRDRPPAHTPCLPCYAINPQVHATDHAFVLENLGGLADTVATAWEVARQPVVISPVTFRPRSASRRDLTGRGSRSQLPNDVDLRQIALFGAAWTLACVTELGGSGHVHTLTLFETTGLRGVMETDAGSQMPELFPAAPASVYPLYHVLLSLAPYAKLSPLISAASRSTVAGCCLHNEAGAARRVLLADLQGSPQRIYIHLPPGRARLWLMNADNVAAAAEQPALFWEGPCREVNLTEEAFELTLPAFAFGRLDYV